MFWIKHSLVLHLEQVSNKMFSMITVIWCLKWWCLWISSLMIWSFYIKTQKIAVRILKKRLMNLKKLCLCKQAQFKLVNQWVVVVVKCFKIMEFLILLCSKKVSTLLKNRWKMYKKKRFKLRLKWSDALVIC